MVVFICNACGQSIKKSKVEKHFQLECANCNVLSCIDCGKEFVGEEYAMHTSCISEGEKYQGKLYKGPTVDTPTKGVRKQEQWLQKVQDTAKSTSLDPKIAQLMEAIASYHNVPRKRKKFENFARNSLHVFNAEVMDQLWDAFSGTATSCDLSSSQDKTDFKENEKEKNTPQKYDSNGGSDLGVAKVENCQSESVATNKMEKKKKLKKEDVPLTENVSDQGEVVTKPKKKKSKQKSKNVLESKLAKESVEVSKADRSTEERDTVMAKKKKKKTEREMEKEETDKLPEDTIPEHSIDLSDESHNKRKKKKKEKKKTEIQDMEEQSPEVLADEQVFKKEKKRKGKQQAVSEQALTEVSDVEEIPSSKKSKTSKSKKKISKLQKSEVISNLQEELMEVDNVDISKEENPVNKENVSKSSDEIPKKEIKMKKKEKKIIQHKGSYPVDQKEEKSQVEDCTMETNDKQEGKKKKKKRKATKETPVDPGEGAKTRRDIVEKEESNGKGMGEIHIEEREDTKKDESKGVGKKKKHKKGVFCISPQEVAPPPEDSSAHVTPLSEESQDTKQNPKSLKSTSETLDRSNIKKLDGNETEKGIMKSMKVENVESATIPSEDLMGTTTEDLPREKRKRKKRKMNVEQEAPDNAPAKMSVIQKSEKKKTTEKDGKTEDREAATEKLHGKRQKFTSDDAQLGQKAKKSKRKSEQVKNTAIEIQKDDPIIATSSESAPKLGKRSRKEDAPLTRDVNYVDTFPDQASETCPKKKAKKIKKGKSKGSVCHVTCESVVSGAAAIVGRLVEDAREATSPGNRSDSG